MCGHADLAMEGAQIGQPALFLLAMRKYHLPKKKAVDKPHGSEGSRTGPSETKNFVSVAKKKKEKVAREGKPVGVNAVTKLPPDPLCCYIRLRQRKDGRDYST